jgi:hypothetical protein
MSASALLTEQGPNQISAADIGVRPHVNDR